MNASDKVFDIPELLWMIFDQLGSPKPKSGVGSDLVSCATVAENWSSSVVPIIWNNSDGASVALFKLLGARSKDKGPLVRTLSLCSHE